MMAKSFNHLDKMRQLDLVRKCGVLLLEVPRAKYLIRLFHLFGLYVEVFNYLESGEAVIINAFSDTSCLQPYLQEIDISGLVQGV
jgi:hypothetical protein